MAQKSALLTTFRLVMMAALVAFMFMIYWSMNLVERDLKKLGREVSDLRKDVMGLQMVERIAPVVEREYNAVERAHIDPSLPNLLEEDSFYERTLPDMLGRGFLPQGIFHQAVVGKPKNLHPFSNWSSVSSWRGLCQVSVSKPLFGKYETLSPNAAIKMEERVGSNGIPEFWVHLRNDLFWEPFSPALFPEKIHLSPHFQKRHRVTAHDFKFYVDALLNPHNQEAGAVSLRNYLGDIGSLEVIDDLTFVVRWKPNDEGKIRYIAKQMTGALEPLARFVYQYFPNGKKIVKNDADPDTYRTSSLWAQNFSEHWALHVIPSCGAWTFKGIGDKQIRFQRNPRYWSPLAALMEEQITVFKEGPETIWQDFKATKTDLVQLQPSQLPDWQQFSKSKEYLKQQEKGLGISRLDYLVRSYNYIAWNMATPYFSNKKVRQAMTMAIDRQRIIDTVLNGMGVPLTGPFFVRSKAYDVSIEPWPYDPEEARRLLEQEGWYDRNDDGVRDKEIGKELVPFRFTLTYYVKNPTSQAICNYVRVALKEIGIECDLHGVDISDLSAAFDEKSFDALLLGWALGSPPEEPRQLWHSAGAKERGSSNAVGFENQEADEIIEKLQFTFDASEREMLYKRFHQIIHEEQPYTFLYIPKAVLLYRDYLQNVFIPADRQDLVPGADVEQPQSGIFWKKR